MKDLYNIINEAFLIKKNQKHANSEKISCVRRTTVDNHKEIEYKDSALGKCKSLNELINMINDYINKVKTHNNDNNIYDEMLDELEDITGFSYSTFRLSPDRVKSSYESAYNIIKSTFDKNELLMCLTLKKGITKEYYFIYK